MINKSVRSAFLYEKYDELQVRIRKNTKIH